MIEVPLIYYAASGLLNFLTSFPLAIFVLVRNPKAVTNQVFSLFCFAVAFWSWFYFVWLRETNPALAEFYLRTCMIGVIFMPSLFTHFVLSLVERSVKRPLLWFNYGISAGIAVTVYTSLYAGPAGKYLVFPYWCTAGPLFAIHLFHFFINVIYSHSLMVVELKKSKGTRKNQLLYVLVGTSIGYICGSTNYFSWYRIAIPPFLNPFILIYVVTVAYAIIQHHLLDIVVASKRGLIFLVIFSLTLGAVFGAGGYLRNHHVEFFLRIWWLVVLAAILVAGVSLWIWFKLYPLAEQKRRREVDQKVKELRKAIRQMSRQRRIETLSETMVGSVVKILGLEHGAVYFYDRAGQNYLCQSWHSANNKPNHSPRQWRGDSLLAQHWNVSNGDGVKGGGDLLERERLEKTDPVAKEMELLEAHVVFPIASEEGLVGFLALGSPVGGRNLEEEEIEELWALTDKALDGYEKIQALDEVEEYHLLRGMRQQLEMMYQMMQVLLHDINNPMALVKGYAQMLARNNNIKEHLTESEKKQLGYIEAAGTKVGAILQEMNRYVMGVKGETAIGTEVDGAIEETLEAYQKEVNFSEIEVAKELKAQGQIWMPKSMFRQVMKTLIQNGWEAMRGKGKLALESERRNGFIHVEVKDSGPGVSSEKLPELFKVNFPTGGESGTGVGLYLSKLVVEAHKGRIGCESEEGKGALFWVELPLFEEKMIHGLHRPPR